MFFSNVAWCNQTPIGLNNKYIDVVEYWKFEDNIRSHEMLICNRTKNKVDVVIRKWHTRPINAEPIYRANDTLLVLNKLKGGGFYILKNLRDRCTGLIEVFVNDKSTGLYELSSGDHEPISEIKDGIIINQTPNVGTFKEYELIYSKLNFKREKTVACKVRYTTTDFYKSFFKGTNSKYKQAEIISFTTKNLKEVRIEKSDNLYLEPSDELGEFEVIFQTNKMRKRITGRNFYYSKREKSGGTAFFVIPVNINFQ